MLSNETRSVCACSGWALAMVRVERRTKTAASARERREFFLVVRVDIAVVQLLLCFVFGLV